jgi:hypothetical protein
MRKRRSERRLDTGGNDRTAALNELGVPMSVLAWLLVAPLGLFFILGLAWFEDRILRPPASPAEQVLQRQSEADARRRRTRPRTQARPASPVDPVAQVAQGTAELLSLVRLQPRRTAARPEAHGRDSAA